MLPGRHGTRIRPPCSKPLHADVHVAEGFKRAAGEDCPVCSWDIGSAVGVTVHRRVLPHFDRRDVSRRGGSTCAENESIARELCADVAFTRQGDATVSVKRRRGSVRAVVRRKGMPGIAGHKTERIPTIGLLFSGGTNGILILLGRSPEQPLSSLNEIISRHIPDSIAYASVLAAHKRVESLGSPRIVEPDSHRPALVVDDAGGKRNLEVRALGNRKRVVAFGKPRVDDGDRAERAVRHFGRCGRSRAGNRREGADRRRENRRARRIRRIVVVEVPSCDETGQRRRSRRHAYCRECHQFSSVHSWFVLLTVKLK